MTNYFSIPFTSLCCLSSKPGSFYSLQKMCSLVLSAVLFCFSFGIEAQRSVCVNTKRFEIVKEGKEMAIPEHEGVTDFSVERTVLSLLHWRKITKVWNWHYCLHYCERYFPFSVGGVFIDEYYKKSVAGVEGFTHGIVSCGVNDKAHFFLNAKRSVTPRFSWIRYAYKATPRLVTPKRNKLNTARLLNGFTSCCIFVVVVFIIIQYGFQLLCPKKNSRPKIQLPFPFPRSLVY